MLLANYSSAKFKIIFDAINIFFKFWYGKPALISLKNITFQRRGMGLLIKHLGSLLAK